MCHHIYILNHLSKNTVIYSKMLCKHLLYSAFHYVIDFIAFPLTFTIRYYTRQFLFNLHVLAIILSFGLLFSVYLYLFCRSLCKYTSFRRRVPKNFAWNGLLHENRKRSSTARIHIFL